MWISRNEFDAMKERLERLESRDADKHKRLNLLEIGIATEEPAGSGWVVHYSHSKEVPVREAIYHILRHLNLRFSEEPSTPARFKLLPLFEKPAKAKKK